MSDIRIQISQEGDASVELSNDFMFLALDKQVEELNSMLLSEERRLLLEYGGPPTPARVKAKIVEGLLSALMSGIKVSKVVWKIKGDIDGLAHDINEEYWLKLDI